MALLCAANQIGKSSVQIRTMLHWATEKKLWPKLWPSHTPKQFWYFYPDSKTFAAEFTEKWVPEFMPREHMKDDPKYGWELIEKKGDIVAISFKSGITVYLKYYSQRGINLQTGTVDAIFCDEELPEKLFSELQFRLTATDGYFRMVFTATLGEQLWERAMERRGRADEAFVGAEKIQVSMYDCQFYEDGSPGKYSLDRIEEIKSKCKSQSEVDRRIYGRFVMEGGRKYENFDVAKNCIPSWKFQKDWQFFGAADPGSGGAKGHPAAICFLAVNADFTKGVVFMCKRMDGVVTTAGDVYQKYLQLMAGLPMTANAYDYDSSDFRIIDERDRNIFVKANKSHETGVPLLNSLFKWGMLDIVTDSVEGFDERFEPSENAKLIDELSSLSATIDKRKAKDDLADTLRYVSCLVPWNMEKVYGTKVETRLKKMTVLEERRAFMMGELGADKDRDEFTDEIDYWNEQYD